MAIFVLIPGAGGDALGWSRLVPELERRGHEAIPVDIREDDPALGLPDYADAVEAAIGARSGVVLVATSLGAFTVPMVAARGHDVRSIVLVNPMIPLPGETPGGWWGNVAAMEARDAADAAAGRNGFSVESHFFNAIAPDVLDWLRSTPTRDPSDTPFGQPCEFEAWPPVPMHVISARDDRFFPLDLQKRVARDRLGVDVDEIDGGHLVALGNPSELADLLESYL